MGFKESDEMIRVAAALLDGPECYRTSRAVKGVIALFAGKAALEDDQITQSVCGECHGTRCIVHQLMESGQAG